MPAVLLVFPAALPPDFSQSSSKFLEASPQFFRCPHQFLFRRTHMNFKNLRFIYECDEATLLKLQSLSGKNHIQTKDFQSIISTLINKTYETSKGKKL
jgi:hypothetical protein